MDIVFLQYVGYCIDIIVVDLDDRGGARRPVFRGLIIRIRQKKIGDE